MLGELDELGILALLYYHERVNLGPKLETLELRMSRLALAYGTPKEDIPLFMILCGSNSLSQFPRMSDRGMSD